jgi:hypothetical protein
VLSAVVGSQDPETSRNWLRPTLGEVQGYRLRRQRDASLTSWVWAPSALLPPVARGQPVRQCEATQGSWLLEKSGKPLKLEWILRPKGARACTQAG